LKVRLPALEAGRLRDLGGREPRGADRAQIRQDEVLGAKTFVFDVLILDPTASSKDAALGGSLGGGF
jgi:hypothetical protein